MRMPPRLREWEKEGTLHTRKVLVVKTTGKPVWYENLEEARKNENLETLAGPFGDGDRIRFESWEANEILSR